MRVALVLVAGLLAGLAFACSQRPPQQAGPPTPRPEQTPLPSPSPTLAARADVEPEASGFRGKVLQALPPDARWQAVASERRTDGALSWRHTRYRVVLPPRVNVKAATGALVKAAEDAGGVLLASRPDGTGQVVELGLEHQGKVLPVLQVRLVAGQGQPTVRALVAVVLDDAGMRLEELDRALRVGRPVALAVLPGLPRSAELARRAREAGLEVLLHLPMEPEDPALAARIGEPAVRVDMSDDEIARAVRTALQEVPGAVGVNNHMGSKATANGRVVRAVLRVLREEGLFFLDSRTTPRSFAEVVAKELGVRVARRAVFLDNDPSPEAVRAQVRKLIAHAIRDGTAVGIGHANRPYTAEVLAEMVAELEGAGVQLVPVGQLAR
ncbi:MAG: divergent polysaccharide deacetylase family protein [Armatimonadota bacterium]|nr:divergent polysaccharide deacetylase family protein [Armatimonadota bacterium]MDW8155146.1 divergent polysaccharide deacetylase family protein [Armatimonadota bacterium]